MIAYAWATGRIEFGRTLPDGAIAIGEGPAKMLRERVNVLARHGYENGVLIVPGVPEAANSNAAVDALIKFSKWLARSMNRLNITAEEFNRRYPVGTEVRYYETIWDENTLSSKTRSEAWTLGHGEPVVLIEGKTGGVSLGHLEIIKEAGNAE